QWRPVSSKTAAVARKVPCGQTKEPTPEGVGSFCSVPRRGSRAMKPGGRDGLHMLRRAGDVLDGHGHLPLVAAQPGGRAADDEDLALSVLDQGTGRPVGLLQVGILRRRPVRIGDEELAVSHCPVPPTASAPTRPCGPRAAPAAPWPPTRCPVAPGGPSWSS